jgi:hypothetical protein
VCATVVIVRDELFEQPPQVFFVQYDDVIEQFPPARTDPALGDAVLPRALVRGPYRLNLHVLEGFADRGGKD